MPGYGTNVYRGNPKALGGLRSVNFLKVNVIGRFARGIVDANGTPVVTERIFTEEDMKRTLGGFDSVKMSPYIIRALFRGLKARLQGAVEVKAIGWVAANAVQATLVLKDIASPTPLDLFTAGAARLGNHDKSTFGNSISIKTSRSEVIKYTLKADMTANADILFPDAIDNLKIGYFLRLNDGTNNVVRRVSAINTATGQVTLASTVGAGITFTAALTVITRIDWSLFIAVDDDKGIPRQKEAWENYPFAKSDTLGLPLALNDKNAGSMYLTLAYITNASIDPDSLPAVLTSWTRLASGADGTAPTDADYLTLGNIMKTYRAAFWLAGESSSLAHNQNMLGIVSDGNFYGEYLVNIPANATQAILENYGNTLRSSIQFGEIPGDKRFNTINPVTGEKFNIPNIGHIAAHWFNSYVERGEEWVDAGNDYPLQTTDELVDNGIIASDAAGNGKRLIVDYRVNILEREPGVGIIKKSGRTLSTNEGYMYKNQVMQTLLYAEEIRAFRRKQEQQPGGADKQQAAQRAVDSAMRDKYEAGKFLIYQKEDLSFSTYNDVVSVVDDITTTPLADLATGKDLLVFQFKAKPPIEFPDAEISSLPGTFGVA